MGKFDYIIFKKLKGEEARKRGCGINKLLNSILKGVLHDPEKRSRGHF